MSSPAPRIAPRAAQPGRPLPHDLRRQHRPTRPRPPPPARGSRRPERSRPGDGRGAPRSADRHRAACRAPGGDGCWGERCGQGRPGARCSAAGPGRHVPRRRRVQRRSTRHKLEEKAERSFPAQRPAAAKLRQLLRRSATTPSGPAGGLSPPAGSSGNRAGKVAAHPSRRLPSVTRWEEESATRRPRNPRLPPSGRPRAPAPPTLAGGDGQEATAISARGEGRSSSAVPTALPAAQKLLLPPPASALSSPFSSAAGGRTPRAAGACVSFRTEEGGRAAEPREPPGCRAPSLGQRTQRGQGSGKGRMGARGQRGREPQRFPPSYEVLAAFQGFLANLVYLVPCVLVQKCKTSNSVVTLPCPPPSKAPHPTPLRAVPGALSRCALTAVFPPANG